ncbi:hypothetical protein Tco_0571153 [Tanacetum coccineum]
MTCRHHDSDVYDAFPNNDFSIQDVQSLIERIIDLRPMPFGLLFRAGLATTWEFLVFFLVFKDTRGNEYYPPLPVDQPIPDKTNSQREVEVEDPKVVAAREKKKTQVARAAAKKKESKKMGNDEGGSSRVKKKRGLEGTKSASVSSCHVSSLVPLRTVAPVNRVISLHNGDDDGESRAPNDDRRLSSHSPCGSVNKFVHHFANVKENKGVEVYKGVEESPPRVETFINMFGIPIHPAKEQVFLSKTNADESSHPEWHLSTGAPVSRPRQILIGWNIEEDTLEWCHELMMHLAPPAAQEESNALTNEVALQRAWFSVARGAMAQTDMLERFENLLADYDALAETYAECSEMVQEYVAARVDLEHNAKLYIDAINCIRVVNKEHTGCGQKAELAKKDSALTYAERLLAKGAKDHKKLTAQLGRAKIEKFDWRTDEKIMSVLHKAEDFDPYSDKKLYPMYDKLFEKEYPYIEKIASGYRHSMVDLLKVHPDPAPSEGTSTPTVSKASADLVPFPQRRLSSV